MSETTKNQQLRDMVHTCVHNQLKFNWVLANIWFSSSETMIHIQGNSAKGLRDGDEK